MGQKKTQLTSTVLESLSEPTTWPNANARLLGVGAGLPVKPLDRLGQFGPKDFERFTLEWASDYLKAKLHEVYEVQQRGGAGDKGRDVIVWHDPPSVTPRRWSLYQCKHYETKLGSGKAAAEIGKVLYYTFTGDYLSPEAYWFVTHIGVTGDLQDLLDIPENLKKFILDNWQKYCASSIGKGKGELTDSLRAHIENFDFSIFRAKQPLELINEHAQTRYHLAVFGLPLIDRPKPKDPPSSVAPAETEYVNQLFDVISQEIGSQVQCPSDFAHVQRHKELFDRSRIVFYCAENLKELARDQMADQSFFDTLMEEFTDGLYFNYTAEGQSGLQRLISTVKAAQSLIVSGHVLDPHLKAKDREGMCHQMANEGRLMWCKS